MIFRLICFQLISIYSLPQNTIESANAEVNFWPKSFDRLSELCHTTPALVLMIWRLDVLRGMTRLPAEAEEEVVAD